MYIQNVLNFSHIILQSKTRNLQNDERADTVNVRTAFVALYHKNVNGNLYFGT